MSTRNLDYDPDRRARESGREEAEVLDARRLVYVEPWYRKLWRYFTYVFALGATAVALGAVIVNGSRYS
ncbi:unnamed protein product [Bathycoccus prasinos]